MMLGFEDRLISNLEKFKFLESHIDSNEYTEDELYDFLQKRVMDCTVIIDENNALLSNELRPMLDGTKNLTPDVADSLFELSFKLYTFKNPLDMGLSLEILEGITKWAKEHNDTDRLVKSLYHTGFIYQQLNDRLSRHGSEAFRGKAYDCFSYAASHRNNYFNIESKETRSYINRCLGNLYVISRIHRITEPDEIRAAMNIFLAKIDDAFEFWNDKKVREFDPDMPWDKYIINAHQNMSSWIWLLSRQKYRLNDKYLIRRVCDSCMFLLQYEESGFINDYWTSHRTDYMEYATMYCLEEISYEEMLDYIRGMYLGADDYDYSRDGLYSNLSTPIDLIKLFKPEDLAKSCFKTEINLIIERMHNYCKNFPVSGNKVLFTYYVGTACKTMVDVLDFKESVELILSLTTYSHLPTYVHSMMIKEISQVIATHIMETKPEYFKEACDSSTASHMAKNMQNVIELIGHAAMCHDVGKVLYLDKVAIFSRKLYNFEFEIIKEHANADSLIDANNYKMQMIVDVIAGHHKWHDNSRGYDENFNSICAKYKSIISIITAADSIDAATDGIGRYYSKVLSLEAVINEIHQQAGSRYCPVISDALKHPSLVSKLDDLIKSGRKKAYYEAYRKMLTDG